ncbi:MAG: hypothetical protein A3G41_01780 [Elusimicrobia bacterium RIFCSPLOWO2_12_FULL_59_9]|nr:MAG: hypothetical protein A3G41_01780 [Elusimicrobia bacterium RIFCSPLOWO2_12_FULL_59_9]
MILHIFIDGAAKGNPGPGGIGIYVEDQERLPLRKFHKFIPHCTNNVAEYTALLYALKAAQKLNARTLYVYSDSQLLVRQFNGEYKIKNPALKELWKACKDEARQFSRIIFSHIPREQNQEADRLANLAVKTRMDVL